MAQEERSGVTKQKWIIIRKCLPQSPDRLLQPCHQNIINIHTKYHGNLANILDIPFNGIRGFWDTLLWTKSVMVGQTDYWTDQHHHPKALLAKPIVNHYLSPIFENTNSINSELLLIVSPIWYLHFPAEYSYTVHGEPGWYWILEAEWQHFRAMIPNLITHCGLIVGMSCKCVSFEGFLRDWRDKNIQYFTRKKAKIEETLEEIYIILAN